MLGIFLHEELAKSSNSLKNRQEIHAFISAAPR